MSKNVIFQYYLDFNGVGKQGYHYTNGGPPDWAQKSVEYFKRYAENHNADYYFFEDRFVDSTSNFFEVTRIFKDPLFDQYDNLLYCDVDVIPKNMDNNIFEELGEYDVAGWPENRMRDFSVDINNPFSGSIVPNSYYNLEKRVISIMIEVRRDLYIDENSFIKNYNYNKIKNILNNIIKSVELDYLNE